MKNKFLSNLARVSASVGLMSIVFLTAHQPVSSQIIPQAWVSLGGKDGDFTYAGGIKIFWFWFRSGYGCRRGNGRRFIKIY